MGTNYYMYDEQTEERIHIGKSSAGWCFTLHVCPDIFIESLEDWVVQFTSPFSMIEDEYGNEISVEEMLCTIIGRHWITKERDFRPGSYYRDIFGYKSIDDFLERNHAEEGPKGLLRHKLVYPCVGHGIGTWDLMMGDFS